MRVGLGAGPGWGVGQVLRCGFAGQLKTGERAWGAVIVLGREHSGPACWYSSAALLDDDLDSDGVIDGVGAVARVMLLRLDGAG